MLSNISQISLEKYLCWSLFLRKLQAFRPANLLKRDSNTGTFVWNWQDFQELFCYRTPPMVAFKISNTNILFKDFSGIPAHNTSCAQLISYNLKLAQWQTISKNASIYQRIVRIERFCNRFRTNSKGSDPNINKFAVLLHFRIT